MTEAQAGQCEPGTNNPIRGASVYGNATRGLGDLGRPPVPEMIRAQKVSDPGSAIMPLQESLAILADRIASVHQKISILAEKLSPVLTDVPGTPNGDGCRPAGASTLQSYVFEQIASVEHAERLLLDLQVRVNL